MTRADGGAALDAVELRAVLDRHVFDAWFPRCIDRLHGGFLCDFDASWTPNGDQVKLLEFQARQTRVAALGCRLRPRDALWSEAVRQGVAVLRDLMWDAAHGGFFALCRRDGEPLDGGDKHGHGTAYAVHALADAARALDDPGTAAFARAAFEWYDALAWDEEAGGYWGWLRADGRPYALCPESAPRAIDHVGTPLGAKDTNVNGDMLETLTELARWHDVPLARQRVARLVELFENLVEATGCLPEKVDRRFRRLGDLTNAGNAYQESYRLPFARQLLGAPLALAPTERTLRAWAATQRGPTGGVPTSSGEEQWWAQFERLRSGALVVALDDGLRLDAERDLAVGWAYLERSFLDEADGGFFHSPRGGNRPSAKGTRWKDASHEAMTLTTLLGLLD